jgi:flagellar biosynthesis protein FlhG
MNVENWLESFKHARPITSSIKTKTVAICSGKGGVGKTSFAIKLAKTLVDSGKRVLVIDCDYNLSNVLIKLGLPINNQFHEFLAGKITLDETLKKMGRLHILPACSGNLDIFDSHFKLQTTILNVLSTVEGQYDYILLDSPAGIAKESLNLMAYCDSRLILLTPDRSSITDSYSLLKILSSRYGANKNLLVLNQVEEEEQLNQIKQRFESTVHRFLKMPLKYIGAIPKLDCKMDEFDREFVFVENNSFHQNFLNIRDNLIDTL